MVVWFCRTTISVFCCCRMLTTVPQSRLSCRCMLTTASLRRLCCCRMHTTASLRHLYCCRMFTTASLRYLYCCRMHTTASLCRLCCRCKRAKGIFKYLLMELAEYGGGVLKSENLPYIKICISLPPTNLNFLRYEKNFLCAAVLAAGMAEAQNVTVSGYVTDRTSGETLLSATVLDMQSGRGTVTNSYGHYSLTLPAGDIRLAVSYVGYETEMSEFRLSRDTAIRLSMRAYFILS